MNEPLVESEVLLDGAYAAEGEALFDAPATEAGSAPLALYRRYRPDTFAQVIGQEHVTEPLQRALANNRVNHAYLFSGPRGCGKTTSARILARCLNCESGPRPEPCGQCQSCRDLARGGSGSIDVIEIDAASHGGVDDARDLRERAFFAPVGSRYKIYVVDEAHMVTTAGFNALLKLVEEPPPHVKFIFATTEPDKVIGTIRSRTHHYPFRLVPPKVLGGYLAQLCEAEGIAVEPAVLPLVVRAGAGSVRDSLSVLDQLLGGADAHGVSYAHAAALLGYTPDSLLDEFVDALAAGDSGGVFACVDKVIEVGQDPRRFAEDLLRRLRDLLVVAAVPDALTSGLVDVSADQAERLSSQAASLGSGELTRAGEVIAAGLTEMRGTTAPRLHLELMCARVLLPGADVDGRGVHARLDRLERRIGITAAHPDAPGPGPAAGGAGPAAAGPSRAAPDLAAPGPEPIAQRPAAPGPEPIAQRPAAPGPEPIAQRPAAPGPEPIAQRPAAPGPEPIAQRPAASGPDHAVPGSHPAPSRAAAAAPVPDPVAPDRDPVEQSAPDPGPAVPTPGPAGRAPSAPPAGPGPGAPDPVRPALSVTDVRRLWPEVLEEVKGRRRFTWILLSQNAHVHEVRDGTLLLAVTTTGARDSFTKGGNEDILREALVAALGVDFAITVMVEPGAASAAGRAAGSRGPGREPGAVPAEPARSEPARSEPARSEPARSEPARSEPARSEPARSEPARSESAAGTRPATGAATAAELAGAAAPDPSASSAPPAGADVREQARSAIRPTRSGAAAPGQDDERDAVVDRNDTDLDEAEESHTELLARQLGAEVIAEEEHGA